MELSLSQAQYLYGGNWEIENKKRLHFQKKLQIHMNDTTNSAYLEFIQKMLSGHIIPVPTTVESEKIASPISTSTDDAPSFNLINPPFSKNTTWRNHEVKPLGISFKYKTFGFSEYSPARYGIRLETTINDEPPYEGVALEIIDLQRMTNDPNAKITSTLGSIDPREKLLFMREYYENPQTIKINNNEYALRKLMYMDGSLNEDGTCNAKNIGMFVHYTEVINYNYDQKGDTDGIKNHYCIMLISPITYFSASCTEEYQKNFNDRIDKKINEGLEIISSIQFIQ